MQVAHDVVPDSVISVADLLRYFDAVAAMKFVQLVRVADQEVHRAIENCKKLA